MKALPRALFEAFATLILSGECGNLILQDPSCAGSPCRAGYAAHMCSPARSNIAAFQRQHGNTHRMRLHQCSEEQQSSHRMRPRLDLSNVIEQKQNRTTNHCQQGNNQDLRTKHNQSLATAKICLKKVPLGVTGIHGTSPPEKCPWIRSLALEGTEKLVKDHRSEQGGNFTQAEATPLHPKLKPYGYAWISSLLLAVSQVWDVWGMLGKH